MLLFIVAAIGIVGSALFGIHGLNSGHAGELDRIFALMSLFMAAAAIVGVVLDDGIGDESPSLLTRDEKVHLVVAAPLVLLMVGVLFATLVPCMFVMLPFFGAKRVIVHSRHPREPRELPPTHGEPAPAYA